MLSASINTLRPRQNGRHFTDDIFKHIFLNENVSISINISLNFIPQGQINSISALALNGRQANIWTNGGLVCCRIYVSLGLNELKVTQKHLMVKNISIGNLAKCEALIKSPASTVHWWKFKMTWSFYQDKTFIQNLECITCSTISTLHQS